jgi:ArsR family transcriptional regulator
MDRLIALFQGLADENRLRIMNLLLAAGELCVCDIERVMDVPQARVSRHLGILRNAGLVEAERHGLWMHYRPVADDELKRLLYEQFAGVFAADERLRLDVERLRQHPELTCAVNIEESN